MALPVTRKQNFPEWYQAVLTAADMAETSSVRGCMVIKPWGYGIWERIQTILDRKIKDTGHDNAYFPVFIPLKLFEKEAQHVEGFAKEMALVTHNKVKSVDGKLVADGPLEEPLVVRPTSEMIISECFSKWVQSYRDLPVLINQWANVVRWEMRTRVFLRTMEFLWQEGHTAHATQKEAEDETMLMAEQYRSLMEDHMAIPTYVGKKSENEKFPGAEFTVTFEMMMQDGKALQSGTSHYLGQNFAKASDIRFQDKDGQMQYVHTTSWGVSTRLIGGLIMTHSDDEGLRLPPEIAPKQIVIVPILRDGTEELVMNYCKDLESKIKKLSYADERVRVHVDKRDRPAPDKKWEWVRKGVPLVLEIGPRDAEGGKVALKMRINDVAAKPEFLEADAFIADIPALLQKTHDKLWEDAKSYRDKHVRTDIKDAAAFKAYFGENKNEYLLDSKTPVGFARVPWSGDIEATEAFLKDMAVTIRYLPIDGKAGGTCVITSKPAVCEAVFGRNY